MIATPMNISNARRAALLQELTDAIRAGRVLLADMQSGPISAGPYRTATGDGPRYALILRAGVARYRSPRHVAQRFLVIAGAARAQAALERAAGE